MRTEVRKCRRNKIKESIKTKGGRRGKSSSVYVKSEMAKWGKG